MADISPPLPVGLSPEAATVLDRSRQQFFRIQKADEVTLRKVNRKAGSNLGGAIMAYDGPPERLTRIFSQVESEITRLNRRVTGQVESSVKETARISLRGQIGAITVNTTGFPATAKFRLDSHNFSRIWHRTVRALSVPIKGIELSSRVWDIHRATLTRMNRYLGRAFAEGVPMSQMSQEIKKFLIIPDSDMRTTRWKRFFEQNPPGRGVYKSAYKNSERVIRTEMNRAFRESAVQYAATKSWVKGVQWVRSNFEPCPICDELSHRDWYGLGPGIYPVEAFPTHSHPNCVCYSVTIPKDQYVLPGEVVRSPGPKLPETPLLIGDAA